MSLPVRVLDQASAELREAALWHENRQVGLGLELLAAVDRTLDSIAEWPRTGNPVERVRPGREVRRMRVERFRYDVVYVVPADHAHVVAVAHERRRPRYWIDRVD